MKKSFKGVSLNGLRDFSKLNFGLQARQIDKALINASLEQNGGMRNNTHLSSSQHAEILQVLFNQRQR
ncbi:hypothetical protein JCM19233_293 [Vibrio astriarenae]|nr:hypothetical protein JCM19233_293 [Vibrio sp. C7]